MAAEAVLCVWAAGSGAPRKGDYRLPGAAEETDAKGGKTAYAAWAGTAQRSERRTDVDAGDDGLRELVLTFELRYDATTLMRSVDRHSLRPVYPDFVCASGPKDRTLAARKALRRFRRGRTAAVRGPPGEQK